MRKSRVNQFLLLAPLFLFGAAGCYLLVFFLRTAAEGAFRDSLLPELIGFCLEGFFLVGLFSLIQRRQERDRKEELRLSLRGALREILSHLDTAMLDEYAEPTNSKVLDSDPAVVVNLIVRLTEVDLDLEDMRNIKTAAARNLSTTHDLIPVAAQLSADHMRWWLSIVASVRHLAEATDRSALALAAHRFLSNLGEFDELHL